MTTDESLFPALLGEPWPRLAPPVQKVHGGRATIRLHGMAEVVGSPHWPARLLRRLMGVPEPGPAQPLEVQIERRADGERWTRRFSRGCMRSRLTAGPDGLLREHLGPIVLRFRLAEEGGAIRWHLLDARMLGLPLPRPMLGQVSARSGGEGDRYAFAVEACLPVLGRWIGYHGTLEIDDGA